MLERPKGKKLLFYSRAFTVYNMTFFFKKGRRDSPPPRRFRIKIFFSQKIRGQNKFILFRKLLLSADPNAEKIIADIVHQIEEETPFTALGFFNVERTTLTSLVATILTYLIIMKQFEG